MLQIKTLIAHTRPHLYSSTKAHFHLLFWLHAGGGALHGLRLPRRRTPGISAVRQRPPKRHAPAAPDAVRGEPAVPPPGAVLPQLPGRWGTRPKRHRFFNKSQEISSRPGDVSKLSQINSIYFSSWSWNWCGHGHFAPLIIHTVFLRTFNFTPLVFLNVFKAVTPSPAFTVSFFDLFLPRCWTNSDNYPLRLSNPIWNFTSP